MGRLDKRNEALEKSSVSQEKWRRNWVLKQFLPQQILLFALCELFLTPWRPLFIRLKPLLIHVAIFGASAESHFRTGTPEGVLYG